MEGIDCTLMHVMVGGEVSEIGVGHGGLLLSILGCGG
jgi:hypothetical protein